MNAKVLRWARLGTLVAAVLLGAGLWPAVSGRFALGVVLMAGWATLGLRLLEALMRRALVPPGTPRDTGRIVLLAGGKLLLYAVALWAVWARLFPPTSLLIGFSLLLAALVVASATTRPSARTATPRPRGEDA